MKICTVKHAHHNFADISPFRRRLLWLQQLGYGRRNWNRRNNPTHTSDLYFYGAQALNVLNLIELLQ